MKKHGLTSFLLFALGLPAFHYGLFPFFVVPIGLNPGRYVYFLILCGVLIASHLMMRLKPNMSLKALYVWLLGYYFYDAILLPPIPWTLFITYMMLWSIGVFLYVSQDPDTFKEFREPIVKTVVGEYKWARIIAFTALPILVGFSTIQFFGYGVTFKGMHPKLVPKFEEPVELRTVHPAPPATTRVHGKTFVLETARNPFRIDEQDKYQNSFPFLDADKNKFMKYVTEGGSLFFENCHFCHGDQLNGVGMFSHVFNPTPANFVDPGTIAMLRESFIFWRVAKGGPGLPNESTPWSSAMPPWEEHLNIDEMWKIILFEFWYTGHHPRTFDTEAAFIGDEEGEGYGG